MMTNDKQQFNNGLGSNYKDTNPYRQTNYNKDHDYQLNNKNVVQKEFKKYTGPSVVKELANVLRDIALQTGSGNSTQTSFSIADIEEVKFVMMRVGGSILTAAFLIAILTPMIFLLALPYSTPETEIAILMTIYFFMGSFVFYYIFWPGYVIKESKEFAISEVSRKFYIRMVSIWTAIEWIVLSVVAVVTVGWYWVMIKDADWIYKTVGMFFKNKETVNLWIENLLSNTNGALTHNLLFVVGLILLYKLMSRQISLKAEKERQKRVMEALIADLSNAEVVEGILDGKY